MAEERPGRENKLESRIRLSQLPSADEDFDVGPIHITSMELVLELLQPEV